MFTRNKVKAAPVLSAHASSANVERPGPDRREPHEEIDYHERKRRHQPQGEQVERALLLQARVDRPQSVPEAVPHQVAKQKAGGEKGERCADA